MKRAQRRASRHAAKALRRLALAEAKKRPARVVVTVVMIALGAGALTTALVLGASVRTALDYGLKVEYAGVDVVDDAGFSTTHDAVGTGGGAAQGIPDADVKHISRLPGIAAVGTVYNTVAVAQVGDVTRGVTLQTLNTRAAFRWTGWSSGRPPSASNEVGLTAYTMHQLGTRLGDEVAIGRPAAGTGLYRVVGVVDTHGSLDYQSGTFGIVTEDAARALSGLESPNEVMIAAEPGVKGDTLVNEINRVAPNGLPRTTRDILNADRTSALQQINTMDAVVAGLAAVSCLVAAITSATTAGASLSSRRRSWALVRCVGASRGQVAGLVAAESLVLGLCGGVVGVLAGLGLARLAFPLVGLVPGLPQLRGSSYTVEPVSLYLPVIVALALAAAGSLVPAWLAARIPPSAALKSMSNLPAPPSSWRGALAGIALVGGLIAAYVGAGKGELRWVAAGAVLALAGFTALLPVLLVAAAKALASRRVATDLRLGFLDVVRRPRAAVIEAVAVVLAVGMIALSWVALSSVQAATSARLSVTDSPDLVVGAVTGTSAIGAGTVQKLAAVDGVDVAVPVTFGTDVKIVGRGKDGPATLTTGTAGGEAKALGSALPKGSPVSAVRDDTVYLPQTPFPPFYPDSKVELVGPDGRVKAMSVRYVDGLQVPTLVSPSTLARVSKQRPTLEVWVSLKDGADRAKALDELAAVAIEGGELPVGGPAVLDVRAAGAFATARAAAVAILAVAVLVAVVGAAATAGLSITERNREHATLRALGLERSRLGRLLATRVIFVSGVAALLGVGMGAAFGVILSRLISATLTLEPRVVVPALPVLVVVLATIAAVRTAALLPIERASYIPPSRAIAQA